MASIRAASPARTFSPTAGRSRIPSPSSTLQPDRDTPQRMPPAGIDELVLPPFELPRGWMCRARSSMKRAGPSRAHGSRQRGHNPTGRVQLVTAGSDSSGRFVLHGVDPLAELTYKARLADSVSAGGIVARAEASLTKPIVLTISPRHSMPLGGRVLDSSGRPIAGASVRVWRVFRGKNDRVMDLEPIMSDDGRVVVRTDAEGRYRAPWQVLPGDEFFAEVSAPGRLSTRSRSIRIDESSQSSFRLSPCAGCVRSPAMWLTDRESPWPEPWCGKPAMGRCRRRHARTNKDDFSFLACSKGR